MALHDLARMTSTTTGTGTLTLGAAVSGFLTFALAGVADGELVRYSIRDGSSSEAGLGTYTASGTTLARTTIISSTNGGSAISCSGNQQVFITALKSDFPVGWQPYAYPIAFVTSATPAGVTLAADGESVACPVMLYAPMLLNSVSVRNGNTSLEHTWGWDLYVDYVNDGLAASNVLTRIAASSADETFTAAAASTRNITAASAPVRLSPGVYWLVTQNRHATNTFSLHSIFASTFNPYISQIKATTNPNGATLDFVAATWSKASNSVSCARLNGRVFGEATEF
jgi:hypothetical protein